MNTSDWVWYREADDALARDDNPRFRAVLGHCPTAVAVLDENGNLVGYNAEFMSLFSTPPPIGAPVGQLFDESPRAMLAEVVALAGTKQHAAAIISMRTTVGEEHEFEFLVATLPGDEPRTIGVVMAAYDRTERVWAEAERSLLARDVGDANVHSAVNLAQAAMCHDLNNVLGVLTLALASLRTQCATVAPESGWMFDEADKAVKHGADIVARARSHSKRVVARSESTDVRASVEHAAQIVAPLARRAKVTLARHVLNDAHVPLGGTELTQVITNLLTNSIHAIQDAQRPGRIDLTVECASPEAVTIRVRDDGVGIEPSRLVDSFEAFQTTRSARGGTGLGLAIAREIIESAGGHIDVLSTPGSATEMHLELPVVARAENVRPAA